MDDHPDLPEIAARMAESEGRFLEAVERSTAHLRRLQRSTRELLMECEALMRPVEVWCRAGIRLSGIVAAVGRDHVILSAGDAVHVVISDQIVAFQLLNER